MKKGIQSKNNPGSRPCKSPKESPEELISRKEALSKAGKYAAFTAASLITILNPVKSQPYSSEYPDLPPEWFE